ncbi:MAG: HAD family hydrolase [Phycisphaerae bacterium]|nr:HAD family hydrolase [Phycisphaerae bacterium]
MAKKAVFIDRDGTLIEHYDYLTEAEQVALKPKASEMLRGLKDRGYLLILITNQSAIARGKLTESKLRRIHDRLRSLLALKGAYLDGIYYCPFHPEAVVEKYRKESDMRKPAPGMLLKAAKEFDIDLGQSWMIGDDDRDILAGEAAGCRTIMLQLQGSNLVKRGGSKPDYIAVNLQEAGNIIARFSNVVPPAKEEKKEEEKKIKPTEPPENKQASIIEVVEEEKKIEPAEAAPPTKKKKKKIIKKKSAESETDIDDDESQKLLRHIYRELKNMNRQKDIEDEFSIFKVLAMILQLAVIGCLIMALTMSIGDGKESNAIGATNVLLTGLIFQVMTIGFTFMGGKS